MKYNIPRRVYQGQGRVRLTIRVPEPLIKELKSCAEYLGWNVTDVIITVVDQFLQSQKDTPKKKP